MQKDDLVASSVISNPVFQTITGQRKGILTAWMVHYLPDIVCKYSISKFVFLYKKGVFDFGLAPKGKPNSGLILEFEAKKPKQSGKTLLAVKAIWNVSHIL